MGRFVPKAYSTAEYAQLAWDRGDKFLTPRISLGWDTNNQGGVMFENAGESNRDLEAIIALGWALHTWAVDGNVGTPLFTRPGGQP